MGGADTFETWHNLTRNLDIRVTLFFASYDSPVLSQDCEDDGYCQTLFIPHTTWTEGRNLLAEEALHAEAKLGKKYKHWAFSDSDVAVFCNHHVRGLGCWNELVKYIQTEMPANAAVLALPIIHTHICKKMLGDVASSDPSNIYFQFSAVSTFDAAFNVIRREHVPTLLPYPTLPEGASEWSSQGALLHVMKHCLKSRAVFPGIGMCNTGHEEYIRGLRLKEMTAVVHANYDSYMQLNSMEGDYVHGQDAIGPTSNSEELNERMTTLNISICEPLADRFADFEEKALNPTRRKNNFHSVRYAFP
jgi:hypothetical protein